MNHDLFTALGLLAAALNIAPVVGIVVGCWWGRRG